MNQSVFEAVGEPAQQCHLQKAQYHVRRRGVVCQHVLGARANTVGKQRLEEDGKVEDIPVEWGVEDELVVGSSVQPSRHLHHPLQMEL